MKGFQGPIIVPNIAMKLLSVEKRCGSKVVSIIEEETKVEVVTK